MLSLGDQLWDRLFQPIDIYCERVDASFFSEPLGLFSNFAFLPAAVAIFYFSRRASSPLKQKRLRILAALALLIGIGSGLFHSTPNALTMAADVLPISAFALVFIIFFFSFLREEGRLIAKPCAIALALISLPGFIARLADMPNVLGGGEFYSGLGPAMFFLSYTDKAPARRRLLAAGGVLFLFAFAARTLDLYLCSQLPTGTHFLWHIINSGVVFVLALALWVSPDFTAQKS